MKEMWAHVRNQCSPHHPYNILDTGDKIDTVSSFLQHESPGVRVYNLEVRPDSESQVKTSFVTFSFSWYMSQWPAPS